MTDKQINNLRFYSFFPGIAIIVLQFFSIFGAPMTYPISIGAFLLFIFYLILAAKIRDTTKTKTIDWITAIAWFFVFVLNFPIFR